MGGDSSRIRFGAFELDVQQARLLRDGRPVKIQPQPLRVLALLASRPGEVVAREELRTRIWDQATFVEFDQGLNYCIRQIRIALEDDVSRPTYVETVKGRGYRFVGPLLANETGVEPPEDGRTREIAARTPVWRRAALFAGVLLVVMTVAGAWLYPRWANDRPVHDPADTFQQITDFTDSAVAPALSPDGRMVAFIRGATPFLTADQIYVKTLPDGEARQLTNDPRMKYGPAFSPDGTEIAYTVVENSGWATYAVPVLGGQPHLLLANAAGLTWLDDRHVMFSAVDKGRHMGVVTATPTRADLRELYFPKPERAMAHYSYPSPDRRSALIVEMEDGLFVPCRLISLDGRSPSRAVGPDGSCRSAGWSPDGQWMYFAAAVGQQQHLWRQHIASTTPEQITFGASEENGVAVDRSGKSLITSIGTQNVTLWMHDPRGDRQLTSEGDVVEAGTLSADGRFLYYLRRLNSAGGRRELRRLDVKSGESTVVFPGVSILEFDISPNGSRAVYTAGGPNGARQLFLAAIDGSAPPRVIGAGGERFPLFGPEGTIVFCFNEGTASFLGRMNEDGSGRAKVAPYSVDEIQSISPQRNWVMAIARLADNGTFAPMAIPMGGGEPVRICEVHCEMTWAPDGKYLFIVSLEPASQSSPGRTLAIPIGAQETLPVLPAHGIRPVSDASTVPGARSVPRATVVTAIDPDTFVYAQTSVHRNLFRLALP